MSMHMQMSMAFTNSKVVTLWFASWTTKTAGQYMLACLLVILLGVAVEALALCSPRLLAVSVQQFRNLAARKGTSNTHESETSVLQPRPHASCPSPRPRLPLDRVITTIIYTLRMTAVYLLMLAAMTFNVGIFICIIAGLAIGNFLFFGGERAETESEAKGDHTSFSPIASSARHSDVEQVEVARLG